jgi:hypothetical protein
VVWAKLDDAILDNPKIIAVGLFGFALHAAAITWCCRNLTDGVVPLGVPVRLFDLSHVRYDKANPLALTMGSSSMAGATGLPVELIIEELKAVGLWEEHPEGWLIHDFLEFNPSKAEILAKRAKNTEKVAAKRARKTVPSGTSRGTRRGTPEGTIRGTRVSVPLGVPGPVPPSPEPVGQGRESPPSAPPTAAQTPPTTRGALGAATSDQPNLPSSPSLAGFTGDPGGSPQRSDLRTGAIDLTPDDLAWARASSPHGYFDTPPTDEFAGIANAIEHGSNPPPAEDAPSAAPRLALELSPVPPTKDAATGKRGGKTTAKRPPGDPTTKGTRCPAPDSPEAEKWCVDNGLPPPTDETVIEFMGYWCGRVGRDGLKVNWRWTYLNRQRELAKRSATPIRGVNLNRPSRLSYIQPTPEGAEWAKPFDELERDSELARKAAER